MNKGLLQRVAAGDEAAVRACMDEYGGLVWTLARRMCRDAADAEDAVQEVFVSLWRSASRFDPSIASETTFVAMIARRRLIDRLRKRRSDEVGMPEELAAAAPETSDREVSEEAGEAMKVLSTLGDDQQRVLRLAILHGLPHERIAASTGLPLGTVKTHIRRGLMKVRERLGEEKRRSGGAVEPVS